MFSAQQRIPTTFTSGRSLPSARMAKSTAPAPAMSPFISHILSPGFRLIPPESKVMPLPTRAIVSFEALRGHVAQDRPCAADGRCPGRPCRRPLVAARLQARRVEDLDLQLHLAGQLAGRVRDHLGGHRLPRLVDQVAAAVHVLRDPRVARLARLGVGLVVGVGEDDELSLLGEELVLLLPVPVEGVGAEDGALDRLAHEGRRVLRVEHEADARAGGSRGPGAAPAR